MKIIYAYIAVIAIITAAKILEIAFVFLGAYVEYRVIIRKERLTKKFTEVSE